MFLLHFLLLLRRHFFVLCLQSRQMPADEEGHHACLCRGVFGTCVSGCPLSFPGLVASVSDHLLHYLYCLRWSERRGHFFFCIKGLIIYTLISHALSIVFWKLFWKEFWKVKSSLSCCRVINKGKFWLYSVIIINNHYWRKLCPFE